MKQKGAALFIVLVLLLVSTLLAISGAQSSLLKLSVANHAQDEHVAWQAAEIALIDAQENASLANCMPMLPVEELMNKEEAWWLMHATISQDTLPISELALPARYLVECVEDNTLYRITARSVGTTKNSVTLLQSVYQVGVGCTSWRQI